MEKYKIAILVYRLEKCCNLNHLVVAKKMVKQEIENLKGITEQNCKRRKLREDNCNYCTNTNCKFNPNELNEIEKEIMEKLVISKAL